ncbi:MAG: META domain-containing protein [Bacteroidota bacterium]
MKAFLIAITAGVLLTACSSTKNIPPTTTVIDTKPTVVKPPASTEKPTKPTVTANPNAKMTGITGKWKFESSSEKDFGRLDGQALPEISFNETDRKVSGSTGCNIFNGFFFTTGDLFNFSPLAVKTKKCQDLSVEKYITVFFKGVGFYKTDGNKVFLYNRNDRNKYVVFTKLGR